MYASIKDMCSHPSANLSIFLSIVILRVPKTPSSILVQISFSFLPHTRTAHPPLSLFLSLANPPALSRPHACSGTDAAAQCLLNTLSQTNTCKPTPSRTRLHVHSLSHTHISVSYVLSHIRTDLRLLYTSHFPAENVQGKAVTQR